jgi:DNA recombination protein RmuC
VKDYNSFVGSLERQVLPTARKLGALDESKVLAPLKGIEEAPRELTAYELVAGAQADLDPELRRQLEAPEGAKRD